MHLLKFAMFIFFTLAATRSFAEGGCPPGQYPQQGNGWRACVPAGGTANEVPGDNFRGPTKVARWVALASDTPKGILGKGLDASSESDAISAAKADCSAHGGQDCQIIGVVKNQCVSMAVGKTQLATSEGLTQLTAEKLAIEKCQKAGSEGCATYYSACAKPALVN
jgi:hypothetical protein